MLVLVTMLGTEKKRQNNAVFIFIQQKATALEGGDMGDMDAYEISFSVGV
ncbi:hypothetical protein [Lysinibacillus xylanilyticus]|nr:hypothetical protein [Lysinibacillus xylanilyticus]